MSQPCVLVTGATAGIGFETALQLLRRGADVLVHGRTASKAASACQALADEVPKSRPVPVHGDLASMSEVVAMVEQVRAERSHIDVLLNNAGIFAGERRLSDLNVELTLHVNHLAHVQLTHALEPLLDAAAPARVVNVSSGAHRAGRFDFDDLAYEEDYDGFGAYARSKLANVLFTKALARRRPSGRYTVNALHPGVIDTQLLRAGFGGGGAPRSEGAKTSLHVALSNEGAACTGRYFSDARQSPASALAEDVELQERVWELSLRWLGIHWE